MNNTSALGTLRRRWWLVVLLAVAGAALGAVPGTAQVGDQITRSYRATHTMLINNSSSLSDSTAVNPSQIAFFATIGEVPTRVKEELGYSGNTAELASQVQVNFDFSTGALTFTSTQDSPDDAEAIANAFAAETNRYLTERSDELYQDRLAASITRLDELEAELNGLVLKLAIEPDDPALIAQRDAISRQYSVAFEQNQTLSLAPPTVAFTTLQQAEAVEIQETTGRGLSAPTSRRTRAIMGAVAGAALGVVLALVLGRMDRKLRTREQAEDVLGMRARVTVPKEDNNNGGGLVVVTGRHDSLADSYRTLRNVVSFVQSGLDPVDRARITLVVSPGPGDGKTSTAANLAAAFVETGERTIAINTDFRRPRLASAVREVPPPEHPFHYEDLSSISLKALLVGTDLQGLKLLDLSSIEATPGELVRAAAAEVLQAAEIADQVVIDSSPVGATAEVLEMVPFADTIVVVSKVGHTSIDAAARTVAVLRDLSTAPMILVLTGMKQAKAPYYEYTDRRGPAVRGSRSRRKEQPVG